MVQWDQVAPWERWDKGSILGPAHGEKETAHPNLGLRTQLGIKLDPQQCTWGGKKKKKTNKIK